jgi:RNA polymerase sigma-70 factor (ECF subfamily)
MKKEIFEQYVSDFGNKLSRLCFSLCRNEHDASDLYQETWLKAYNSYDKTDVHNFEKWLYAICVNLFKDAYRKKLRGPQEIIFDSNEHKDAFMSSVSAEDEYCEPDYSKLYDAIDKLPEKLRVCISLKYFSNLSCAEMSAILEISVSAVTTRLSRAIKALAKEMNKGEENGI